MSIIGVSTNAQDLDSGFVATEILGNLQDPASFAFSPDGRLFYGERITGNLQIAQWDSENGSYLKSDSVFYKFNVPSERHRSSGLRGFVFDPNFATNGYIYAYYMQHNPRHNRVVRIQASESDPNKAVTGETLLMEVPYNASTSSGSHNGGDLVFGTDDKLYFTTGDGWNGGDDVQSLNTFTGKVLRINTDGSIPMDNPFYASATGNYRGIYALGLRNPYSVSNLSGTGQIYINDAVGNNKATVYKLTAGANYGHDGYNGIGTSTPKWLDMSLNSSLVITGGLWYPSFGYWPQKYHGNYFAAFWGSNSNNAPGAITRAVSETNISKFIFYDNMLLPGGLKPVMLKLGLDENIYYLMTDYETGTGAIYKISYENTTHTALPYFTPEADQYDNPIQVSINHDSSNIDIYFTLDGSDPDSNSTPYVTQISVDSTTLIKAIAYAQDTVPSQVLIGEFIIGPIPNEPPVANAGPDLIGEVNKEITLNGSDSFDPDGSPLELQEHWVQVAGPLVNLFDDDETVANFTPTETGLYAFKIVVEDIYGLKDSSQTIVTVLPKINDYLEHLIARWSFEEGQGIIAEDTSPNSNTGSVENASWDPNVNDSSQYSLKFFSENDRVEVGPIDVTGQNISISFWTKLNSYDYSDARFISKAFGQFDEDHYWMISTLNDSKLRFRLKTEASNTATLSTDLNTMPLDQWIFITATYDGVFMKLFKNGIILDSLSKSGNLSTNPSVTAAIGNQPGSASGGARPIDGWVDEMRIYSTSLTNEQIQKIYQARFQELCLNDLVINQLIPMLNLYKAKAKLTSSAQISNLNSIIYSAGESIELNDSFSVELGATFVAKMEGCIH